MGRKPGRRLILGAVVVVPVLAAIVWRASVPICSGTSPRYPDKGRLYRIAEALVAISPDGDFPMKDGALDVYAVFRNGSISIDNLHRWGGRARIDFTEEEIARGDYTNFPWERCRGDGRRGGTPFPLLWERQPGEEGLIVVALSDGFAYLLTREELDAALRAR